MQFRLTSQPSNKSILMEPGFKLESFKVSFILLTFCGGIQGFDHSGLLPSQSMTVYYAIEIVDISAVNIENMDFRLDFFVKQLWVDESINVSSPAFPFGNHSRITLTDDDGINQILWTPDFFIPNSRFGAQPTLVVTTSQTVLYINRTVTYSARLWAVLGCQMEFHWYPMDVQSCQLTFESYTFTARKVSFVWEAQDPVILPEGIKLLRYGLLLPLRYRNSSEVRLGASEYAFSRVEILFLFERQVGHHLIITYTPTILIVSLSWFSFWIGMDAIPARVSLLVTSMLTLVTMFSGFNKDIPPVAYIKMMDMWMVPCMVFVFAAMGEFIVVKHMYDQAHPSKEVKHVKRLTVPNGPPYSNFPTKEGMIRNLLYHQAWAIHIRRWKEGTPNKGPRTPSGKEGLENWEKLDKISRVLFPVLFFVFVSVYVPIIVAGSKGQVNKFTQKWPPRQP